MVLQATEPLSLSQDCRELFGFFFFLTVLKYISVKHTIQAASNRKAQLKEISRHFHAKHPIFVKAYKWLSSAKEEVKRVKSDQI